MDVVRAHAPVSTDPTFALVDARVRGGSPTRLGRHVDGKLFAPSVSGDVAVPALRRHRGRPRPALGV